MSNYYVTVAGAGDNSGDSWANAMTQAELETLLETTVAAGDNVFVAGGTYTLTSDIYAGRNGTAASRISIIGVDSGTTAEPPTTSDYASGSDRPLFNSDTVTYDMSLGGNYFDLKNFRFTGNDSNRLVGLGANAFVYNCSFQNNYNSSGDIGFAIGNSSYAIDCEFISTYGIAVTLGLYARVLNSYIHDSLTGVTGSDYISIEDSIIDTCSATGIVLSADYNSLLRNLTIYGCGSGITATGNCTGMILINSTISNCTDGLKSDYSGTIQYYWGDYNNWYNNTRDMSWDDGSTEDNSAKGPNDIALDPSFTDASNGDFSIASGSNLADAGFGIQLGVG